MWNWLQKDAFNWRQHKALLLKVKLIYAAKHRRGSIPPHYYYYYQVFLGLMTSESKAKLSKTITTNDMQCDAINSLQAKAMA